MRFHGHLMRFRRTAIAASRPVSRLSYKFRPA